MQLRPTACFSCPSPQTRLETLIEQKRVLLEEQAARVRGAMGQGERGRRWAGGGSCARRQRAAAPVLNRLTLLP
jgi:hypothetical protein